MQVRLYASAYWCILSDMPRLTINLSDECWQALKEEAARCGKTMGALVDESLEFYGVKNRDKAMELLCRAREASQMDEEGATKLAVEATRTVR